MSAPTYEVKKQKYVVVEYPAFVENFDKALETLGGIENFNKVYNSNEDLLPLNFRPNDPFSHSTFGDRVKSASLVVDVKSNGFGSFDAEVVGVVPATYRFGSMADFQWLPSSLGEVKTDPSLQKAEIPESFDEDNMSLLPPIFSKVDLPFDYKFVSNPYFRTEEKIDADGNTIKEFVPKSKRTDAEVEEVHVVDCEVEEVPMVSTSVARPEDAELVEELKKLFEERPIWCKNFLYSHVSDKNYQKLKTALPVVSYHFHNGPWRKSWIRLGYDPRKHTEARVYQVIDFRVKKHDTRGLSTSSWGKVKINPRRSKVSSTQGESEKSGDIEYRFQKPPSQQQTIYQVCDIEILSELAKSCESNYNKETGWYSKKVLADMRVAMKDHLKKLIKEWDEYYNENETPATPGKGNLQNLIGKSIDEGIAEENSSSSEEYSYDLEDSS